MLISRKSHGLGIIKTYNTFVYAVGGKNKNGYIGMCEVYDMFKNKWRKSASLNEPKTIKCVYPFKNRYLYAFGGVGMNTINYTVRSYKTIEKLDVCSEEDGWERITLKADEGVAYVLWDQEDFELTAGAFRPINPTEIMVFRSSALVWNIEDDTLRYQAISGINDELGPPVVMAKGYMYFTYNSSSLKMAYSHYSKRYIKINK